MNETMPVAKPIQVWMPDCNTVNETSVMIIMYSPGDGNDCAEMTSLDSPYKTSLADNPLIFHS